MYIQLHAQRKKAVTQTGGFVVISRSKLDPHQEDLLYIRVAHTTGLPRVLLRNMKHVGYPPPHFRVVTPFMIGVCVCVCMCACVCARVCVNGLFGIIELCGCDSADESMKH